MPDGVPTAPVAEAAMRLLRAAHQGVAEATAETEPASRYVAAHLAALRTAAAVVTARGKPLSAPKGRPRSVWVKLPQVAPELAEWSARFESGAGERALAEVGLRRDMKARVADQYLEDAMQFLALVEMTLGVQAQPPLPLRVVTDQTA